MTRFIANVLSRRHFEMGGPSIVNMLAARFGEFGVVSSMLATTIPEKDGFILDVGGTHIAVAYEPFAMPFDELRPPETTRRDAVGLLTDHRTHAMMGVLSPCEGRVAQLRAAMALLQTAAILCEAPGASAVLWSTAQTLTAAEPFRVAVAQASSEPKAYPLGVLCRFSPFQSGTENGMPRIGAVATGLARYVGRDLELAPRPRPLMDMMNNMGMIAGWLLQGLEIEDGHSYGRSDRERIRIYVADAGQVLPQPVFLCEVEELDPLVGERLQ